jgi:hypothetical protein
MGALYERASRVIVWLGQGDNEDNTSTAIELLAALHARKCEICREKQDHRLGRPPFMQDHASQPSQLRTISSPGSPGALDEDPIMQILSHDWFTRTWIIQELILGSLGSGVTIKSGHSEIEWACFIDSLVEYEKRLLGLEPNHQLVLLHNSQFLPNVDAVIALERSRRDYTRRRRKSFLELLELFAYARSSESRDKFFALLNLANDWPSGEIPKEFWPDYQSSEDEVLISYAKGFVQPGGRTKVLDLLYRAGSDKSCRFCTWMPDLMGQGGNRKYPPTISNWKAAGSGRANNHYAFHACGPMPTVASISPTEAGGLEQQVPVEEGIDAQPRPPVLYIRGYVVDLIEGLGPINIGSTTSSWGMSIINPMGAWEDILAYTRTLSTYPRQTASSVEWRTELLVRLLIGDVRGPCVPHLERRLHVWDKRQWLEEEAEPESPRWPDNLVKELSLSDPGQDASGITERPRESQKLWMDYWQTAKAFLDLIPGAKYCTTRGSYVGIVPGATEPGDRIFIPHGSAVPFVIRPGQGTTGYHKLIGECYIHGLMYYEKSDKREWSEQEISLM